MRYLRHLKRGEILPGYPQDAHNAFYDTYKLVNEQPGRSNGTGASASVQTVAAMVINTTGADIAADFPILDLDKPTFTTEDKADVIYRTPFFDGKTPDDDTQLDGFVIVQGPIRDDDSPRSAVLLGPSWCDVEFTNEDHTHARTKSGDDTQLKSASSGVLILWHEEIPDPSYLPMTLRCLVHMGGSGATTTFREARVTTEVAAATGNFDENWGEGEVILLNDTTGEEEGDPITVKNRKRVAWVVDNQVTLNMAFSPPRVENGHCAAVDWDELS